MSTNYKAWVSPLVLLQRGGGTWYMSLLLARGATLGRTIAAARAAHSLGRGRLTFVMAAARECDWGVTTAGPPPPNVALARGSAVDQRSLS